jgi:hypothetical protein
VDLLLDPLIDNAGGAPDPFAKGVLAAAVIPLLLVVLTAILQALRSGRSIKYADSTNIAVDLIFVSIGGAGAAFHFTSHLGRTWGIDGPTGVQFVLVLDMFLAAALLYARRFWGPSRMIGSIVNLSVGAATVILVGLIPYMGQ